jgi:DNA-binding transcriptional ArsR family regulator
MTFKAKNNCDLFTQHYMHYLDGTYDCVDRIVINAYFIIGQTGGGFRTWWRRLMGDDQHLDNTHLMRFAGRFSRRIRASAQKRKIPLIFCPPKERKPELTQQYMPKDPLFQGVFCILVNRAPASVIEVKRFDNGHIDIRRKQPYPYVNHYSFHIMDPDWGHMIIRLCPHPPFNAQIILNGHEYVARQATQKGIDFTKEDNCFTQVSNAAGLARIADTMRAKSSVGRMVQVCRRWIYSACLCFALTGDEQTQSGFEYSFSVYQAEYSRNLIFTRGRIMDQVFDSVIDRTRAPLNIKTIKTIFGCKHRPFYKHKSKRPKIEVVLERPVYDLTIFKIHFGKLTVKIYSKGERVLRTEAIAHNAKDLRCRRKIDHFAEITDSLKAILERFVGVLNCIDACFIDDKTLDNWPRASKLGASRVAGIDINKARIRAVMQAVVSLSLKPNGFSASDLAEKVREISADLNTSYQVRQASYDLKKLRAKNLARKIEKSRRYEATTNGLRQISAYWVLREKILIPLLASAGQSNTAPRSINRCKLDIHYDNVKIEMQHIFDELKIAA